MEIDGWVKDTGQTAALTNVAYAKRRKAINLGGRRGCQYLFLNKYLIIIVDFVIPLHNDVITATRDLQPGFPIEVRMIRMPDDFVLWVPKTQTSKPRNGVETYTKYSIKLMDLRISVKKNKVVDKIFNGYYNGLKKIPEIPFTRNMVRSYTRLAGVTDLGARNFINQAQLPESVYVVSFYS